MFKGAMVLLVALAFTACATAPASPPPAPSASATCSQPPYVDKNERFSKGNMGGQSGGNTSFNCGK